MREVRVSGGYNDPLITDVGDLGEDLDAVTAKGMLWPESATSWPAQADAGWQPAELEDNGDGTAAVSQLVSAVPAAGEHCHWWLQLQVGALRLLLRVRDPEDPERPWHIWVH